MISLIAKAPNFASMPAQAINLYSVVRWLFNSDRELKITFMEYIFWESNTQKST